jgi:hypothetical protein
VPIIRKNEYTSAWDLPDIEADTILGFNEPNHRGQDNMSPEETAREWVQIQVGLLWQSESQIQMVFLFLVYPYF